MQDNLLSVKTHSSKLHTFLGIHQIEQQVHQYQQYVDDLEKEDSAKEFNIKMNQNDEIEKIVSQLESQHSLREITVAKTETKLNRVPIMRREAQVQSREQSSISNMIMNIETKIDMNIRVIYSGHNSNAVCCVDESGKQIWLYGQDLLGPWGLCTDTYGNIFVIDQQFKKVIVISKDGQNSKVLINEEDRLEELQCICFNHNESSGFMCDLNGTYIAKFNVSSG
ncbi:Hypothetical predicted protein [Mytilus galloprovincialis]|uniref:Uncharacterized protein n=1 Tax=Mytilus galloprovincialis TaxID=29158 RepID=A0A8B6DDD9_MYTGA|nr:Hypothetical predicted protein [Mytilus galloprovincialis]